METKLKQWGDSVVIVLPKEFRQIRNLEVNDIVDISDVYKVCPNKFMREQD